MLGHVQKTFLLSWDSQGLSLLLEAQILLEPWSCRRAVP